MTGDLRDVVVIDGIAFGIGADGLGEYAEAHRDGKRLDIRGPCLDHALIRRELRAMMRERTGREA